MTDIPDAVYSLAESVYRSIVRIPTPEHVQLTMGVHGSTPHDNRVRMDIATLLRQVQQDHAADAHREYIDNDYPEEYEWPEVWGVDAVIDAEGDLTHVIRESLPWRIEPKDYVTYAAEWEDATVRERFRADHLTWATSQVELAVDLAHNPEIESKFIQALRAVHHLNTDNPLRDGYIRNQNLPSYVEELESSLPVDRGSMFEWLKRMSWINPAEALTMGVQGTSEEANTLRHDVAVAMRSEWEARQAPVHERSMYEPTAESIPGLKEVIAAEGDLLQIDKASLWESMKRTWLPYEKYGIPSGRSGEDGEEWYDLHDYLKPGEEARMRARSDELPGAAAQWAEHVAQAPYVIARSQTPVVDVPPCVEGTIDYFDTLYPGITRVSLTDGRRFDVLSAARQDAMPTQLKHNPQTRAGWWQTDTDGYLVAGVFARELATLGNRTPSQLIGDVTAATEFLPPVVQRAWTSFLNPSRTETTPVGDETAQSPTYTPTWNTPITPEPTLHI